MIVISILGTLGIAGERRQPKPVVLLRQRNGSEIEPSMLQRYMPCKCE